MANAPFKMKYQGNNSAFPFKSPIKYEKDPKEESDYVSRVKAAGLMGLYKKEGENAFTKPKGSYSPDVQAKIEKYGL